MSFITDDRRLVLATAVLLTSLSWACGDDNQRPQPTPGHDTTADVDADIDLPDTADASADAGRDPTDDATTDIADILPDAETDTPDADLAGMVTIVAPEARTQVEPTFDVAISYEGPEPVSARWFIDGIVEGTTEPLPSDSGEATIEVAVPNRVMRSGDGLFTVSVALLSGDEVLASTPPRVLTWSATDHVSEMLASASAIPEAVDIRPRAGRPSVVVAHVPVAGASPVERAEDFLRTYGSLWGIDAADDGLALAKVHEGREAWAGTTVRWNQVIANVPVLGGSIGVHVVDDQVTHAVASPLLATPHDIALGGTVEDRLVVGRAAAGQAAVEAYEGGDARVVGQPRLVWTPTEPLAVLDRGGAPLPDRIEPVLAWRVRVMGTAAGGVATDEDWLIQADDPTGPVVLRRATLLIDAEEGDADMRIQRATPEIQPRMCRPADEGRVGAEAARLVCDEHACSGFASPESRRLQESFHTVYDFYVRLFDRASWDGLDHQLWGLSDVSVNNAVFGSCGGMWFGMGFTTVQVVGHEFTHGVVYTEVNSVYLDGPGAVNEAVADVLGNAAWVGDGEWDCPSGETRPCAPPRDHIREYCSSQTDPENCSGDNGGVHSNSGIFNIVATLIAGGGEHPDGGPRIQGIGAEKMATLVYDVIVHDLDADSGLTALVDALRARAYSYARTPGSGFTLDDACTVRNAAASAGFYEPDSDCDGVPDAVGSDDDGDGIPDELDNCPTTRNGDQDDGDADGIGDVCDDDIDGDGTDDDDDNCPRIPNPQQDDRNRDGVGDACSDADGDRWMDTDDYCPDTYDPSNDDLDRDGDGDACDDDIDGDGLLNNDDNCPEVRNYGQRDRDEDGIGDDCDNCPDLNSRVQQDYDGDGLGNPCDPDDDNDGWNDREDNCPFGYNPSQLNHDGEGLGTACDEDDQVGARNALFDAALPLLYPIEDVASAGIELPLCVPGTCAALAAEAPIVELYALADAPVQLFVVGTMGESLGTFLFDGMNDVTVAFEPSSLDWQLMDSAVSGVAPSFRLFVAPLESTSEVELSLQAAFVSVVSRTARCGDGTIEGGETCEPDAAPPTCADVGSSGTATCGPGCVADYSECAVCGDDVAEGEELCDGDDLRGATCESLGFAGGDLACDAGCGLDTTSCSPCNDPVDCPDTNACLATGRCGVCSPTEPCIAPYACSGGECVLF